MNHWLGIEFQRYTLARDRGLHRERLPEMRSALRQESDQVRRQYRSRAGRLWAAQDLDHILGPLLCDELEEGEDNAAAIFAAVESVKARVLLDQLSGAEQTLADPALQARAAQMERELLSFRPYDDKQEAQELDELRLSSLLSIGSHWDRNERADQLAAIERLYEEHGAGFGPVAVPVALAAVQQALQPDEVLIEYCIPFHPLHPAIHLWIVAITAATVRALPVPLKEYSSGFIGRMIVDGKQPMDASPLGSAVVGLRTNIRKGEDADARAGLRAMYQLLLLPLVDAGVRPEDFRRWIIVPHGVLHYVPFGALRDEAERCLIERVAVTLAPSASAWWHTQQGQRQPVQSFLGLANPDLHRPDLPPLAAADQELKRIVKRLPGVRCSVYSGPAATEVALRRDAASAGIVHLATHGEFPERDAIDFHRVLLTASGEHDGHVTAEELRALDLRQVRLFALSICNGGLYRFGPGDEPYGLIAALLLAGVENVLSTLWPLEDDMGRLFMSEYYKHLGDGGPAHALSQASRQFIKDQSLLRHWSGFALVGPGRPIL